MTYNCLIHTSKVVINMLTGFAILIPNALLIKHRYAFHIKVKGKLIESPFFGIIVIEVKDPDVGHILRG